MCYKTVCRGYLIHTESHINRLRSTRCNDITLPRNAYMYGSAYDLVDVVQRLPNAAVQRGQAGLGVSFLGIRGAPREAPGFPD